MYDTDRMMPAKGTGRAAGLVLPRQTTESSNPHHFSFSSENKCPVSPLEVLTGQSSFHFRGEKNSNGKIEADNNVTRAVAAIMRGAP